MDGAQVDNAERSRARPGSKRRSVREWAAALSLVALLVPAYVLLSPLISVHTDAQTPKDPTPAIATLYELDTDCNTTVVSIPTPGSYVPWTTAGVFHTSTNFETDLTDAQGDAIVIPATRPYLISFEVAFKGAMVANYIAAVTVDGLPTEQRLVHSGTLADTIGGFTTAPMAYNLIRGNRVRIAFTADTATTITVCSVVVTVQCVGGI